MTDGNGGAISVTPTDVTLLSATPSTTAAPTAGSNSFFETANFIGAVSEADDWVTGWTVGLTVSQ